MKELYKKLGFIIIIGAVIPLAVIFLFNKKFNTSNSIFAVQYVMNFVVVLSSAYVFFESIKNFKNNKALAVVFITLSSLFFLYSASMIFLQFSFRHGIGF